jgi:renalase
MKVAIIGAGVSGANIYSLLQNDKHNITIFEKSRGVAGRCSTKYIDDKYIDHGTPFFEVVSEESKQFFDTQVQQHKLTKVDERYYPLNGINQICKALIKEEDLIKNTKIISCKYQNQKRYYSYV